MKLHAAYGTHRMLMWGGLGLAVLPVTLAMGVMLSTGGTWPDVGVLLVYFGPPAALALVALRWPHVAGYLFVAGGVGLSLFLLPFVGMGLYSMQSDGVDALEWAGVVLMFLPGWLPVIGGVLLLRGVRRHNALAIHPGVPGEAIPA